MLQVLSSNSFAQTVGQQSNQGIYSNLANVDDRLKNIESQIVSIDKMQSHNFADQFSKLIQLMFVIIGLSVTFLIFIGNTWIKERVTSLHETELEKTKTKLGSLICAANADVGANIYTTIGGHCIDLYKNFDAPSPGGRHHELYKSYVTMSVRIAANAYVYASELQKFVDSQPSNSLTVSERIRYKKVVDIALNNYVFYLAQRNTQNDKDLLIDLLPKLIKVAADKKASGEKWWDYEDTIIWAKLHLDRNEAAARKVEIQAILDSSNVCTDWRAAVKERYELYNKTCTNEAEKVIL